MDYGIIVRRSFEIAWKYKLLWIFGLFAAGSGTFNLDYGDAFTSRLESGELDPGYFLSEFLLPLISVALVLLLLYVIAHCISVPALIDAVNRIVRGGQFSFGASFSTGIDYFFRIFGLNILLFTVAVAVMAVFAAVVVLFALMFGVNVNESAGVIVALVIIAIIIAIPIMLVLAWFITTLKELAMRALVVRNISIADSLAEGWYLLKNHTGKSIVVYLIYVGINMGFAFVLFILFAFVQLFIHGSIGSSPDSIVTVFIWGLIAGLPFSIVVGGLLGTSLFNLYTLFYFSLVDPASMREIPVVTPQPLV